MNYGKIVSRNAVIATLPPRKKSKQKTCGGMIFVPIVAALIFVTLLQLFDPLAHDENNIINNNNKNASQSATISLEQMLKSGNAVHDSLAGFTDVNMAANSASSEKQTFQSAANDKQEIIRLLQTAGVPMTSLTLNDVQRLPKWSHITDLYGVGIVVLGKERCQEYRKAVKQEQRILGVAGMFNTGTNLLEIHLLKNVFKMESLWQVPWGKHRMAHVKWNHTAPGMDKHNKEHVLPIVIVRDPYAWFQSMCKSPYNARWRHGTHHCPNMIPDEQDRIHFKNLRSSFVVRVVFDSKQQSSFDSLAHLWTEWYREYLQVDYPRLIIRFEDLVFQPDAVLQEIAECAGATVRRPIRFTLHSSKSHGAGTDYVAAVIKTGDSSHRLHNMTAEDIAFAQKFLDNELMQVLHYHK